MGEKVWEAGSEPRRKAGAAGAARGAVRLGPRPPRRAAAARRPHTGAPAPAALAWWRLCCGLS